MTEFSENYWNDRWNNGQTGWDVGEVSSPIKAYINQLKNKNLKILIPGCGNAYEGEYLVNNGFKNTFLIDISETATQNLKRRIKILNPKQIFHQNFFDHQGSYDIILEQTFFCALPPSLRQNYVDKIHELLRVKGKLVGVLFNDPLNTEFPPFGGNLLEYKKLFDHKFNFRTFENCYNSIPARANRELFIILEKK